MIPFIRSITELMVITKPQKEINVRFNTETRNNLIKKDTYHTKRDRASKDKELVKLPSLPRIPRYKWIKSKEAVSRFLDTLDYNNQIQSTYDLTLLERQKNHEDYDAA